MALPGSGQLSLDDIASELGVSNTNFSLGNPWALTDPNPCSPSAPDDVAPWAVSEFYDYDHAASCCTSFGISGAYTTSTGACAGTVISTAYASVPDLKNLTTGDTIYTNSGCSTTFNGFGRYYLTDIDVTGGPNYLVFQINSSGVIIWDASCI